MVGGGVVGSAVAYRAAGLGADVTLVDAGEGRASDVPGALLNPVRGQNGRVDPDALAGLAETWALVDALAARGFAVPHGRTGVLRPVPDERAREKWAANLPPDLDHAWLDPTGAPGLAPGWHAVLSLPGGGWLDGAAFTAALRAASGARTVAGWATEWDGRGVTLASGEHLDAERVVWCGGSIGASRAGLAATHRRGSLLLTSRPAAPVPLSFGVYAAPAATGGVLGATFEVPSPAFDDRPPALASLAWLLGKAATLLADLSPEVTGRWTGSRLSTAFAGRRPDGSFVLSGLGSKGFLLGPLLARRLVEDPVFAGP